jgi:hypothetical protein
MHAAGSAPAGVNGTRDLVLAPHVNERFANVCSRTIAYTADGIRTAGR